MQHLAICATFLPSYARTIFPSPFGLGGPEDGPIFTFPYEGNVVEHECSPLETSPIELIVSEDDEEVEEVEEVEEGEEGEEGEEKQVSESQ